MTWIFKFVVENYSCSKAKIFRFLWTYFKDGSNETDDQSAPHLTTSTVNNDLQEVGITERDIKDHKGHIKEQQRRVGNNTAREQATTEQTLRSVLSKIFECRGR